MTQETITKSKPSAADLLTALLYDSRSHWDYPRDYAEASRPLLRITDAFIEQNPVYQLNAKGQIVAFYSFSDASFGKELNNLWVLKSELGKGYGQKLWQHAVQFARESAWSEFFMLPDPGAEGFYLRMGAQRSGETLPSRLPNGPVFQKMIYQTIET